MILQVWMARVELTALGTKAEAGTQKTALELEQPKNTGGAAGKVKPRVELVRLQATVELMEH